MNEKLRSIKNFHKVLTICISLHISYTYNLYTHTIIHVRTKSVNGKYKRIHTVLFRSAKILSNHEQTCLKLTLPKIMNGNIHNKVLNIPNFARVGETYELPSFRCLRPEPIPALDNGLTESVTKTHSVFRAQFQRLKRDLKKR